MAEKKRSMEEQLADWQHLSRKVLEDQAVSQGAYVEGNKDSEQNSAENSRKTRDLLEKESDEATKEREKLKQKQLDEAAAEREKLKKDAEKA
jgi:hypothetical protein